MTQIKYKLEPSCYGKFCFTCIECFFDFTNESIAVSICLLICQYLNEISAELVLLRLSASPLVQNERNLLSNLSYIFLQLTRCNICINDERILYSKRILLPLFVLDDKFQSLLCNSPENK